MEDVDKFVYEMISMTSVVIYSIEIEGININSYHFTS